MTTLTIDMDYLALSHHLRIPLTEILGMAEILSETELSRDQKLEVEIIQNAGMKLLEIVNRILSEKAKLE